MPLSLTAEELVAHIDRGFSVVSQLGFIPPGLDIDAVETQVASQAMLRAL